MRPHLARIPCNAISNCDQHSQREYASPEHHRVPYGHTHTQPVRTPPCNSAGPHKHRLCGPFCTHNTQVCFSRYTGRGAQLQAYLLLTRSCGAQALATRSMLLCNTVENDGRWPLTRARVADHATGSVVHLSWMCCARFACRLPTYAPSADHRELPYVHNCECSL